MTAAHKCLEGKSSVKGKIMAGRWVGSTLYRMELWNIHLEKKWYIFWKTSKDKIKKKKNRQISNQEKQCICSKGK